MDEEEPTPLESDFLIQSGKDLLRKSRELLQELNEQLTGTVEPAVELEG